MQIALASPASFANGQPHDQFDWLREVLTRMQDFQLARGRRR